MECPAAGPAAADHRRRRLSARTDHPDHPAGHPPGARRASALPLRGQIIDDDGYRPEQIIQTTRLGIPLGRDEHLPYRFVDLAYAAFCTRNPLGRTRLEGRDYRIIEPVRHAWKTC